MVQFATTDLIIFLCAVTATIILTILTYYAFKANAHALTDDWHHADHEIPYMNTFRDHTIYVIPYRDDDG